MVVIVNVITDTAFALMLQWLVHMRRLCQRVWMHYRWHLQTLLQLSLVVQHIDTDSSAIFVQHNDAGYLLSFLPSVY